MPSNLYFYYKIVLKPWAHASSRTEIYFNSLDLGAMGDYNLYDLTKQIKFYRTLCVKYHKIITQQRELLCHH